MRQATTHTLARVLGVLTALAGSMAGAATALAAQEVVVDGWVVDAEGEGIPGAIVELGTAGAVLTDDEGAFRFEGVEAGTYRLQATAFGYEDYRETLDIRTDRTLTLTLAAAAFELDSLVVGAERVEVRGRLRDPVRDRDVPGADILTSQGHSLRSGAGGRFDFEAWENVPVRVVVLAFGYFAADTVFEPARGDERFVLELTEDPVVSAMLGAAIRRLDARAGGRRTITMPALERDEIARWRGAALDEVLRLEYPARARRVRCVVVDEWAMTPMQAEGFLTTTPAWEVERMEFLFDGAMLRIYTREFMKEMLSGGVNLAAPVYVEMAEPPFCA
jgi:hypothetical protein